MKSKILFATLFLVQLGLAQNTPTMVIHTTGGPNAFTLSSIDSITFTSVIPSTRTILFVKNVSGNDAIFTSDETFSNPTQLTIADTACSRPRWSPDGSKITYYRGNAMGQNDVWVMNANGTGKLRLTNSGSNGAYFPCWHNDGNRVIYVTNGTDPTQEQIIRIVNIDGTNDQMLFNNANDKDMQPFMNPVNSDKIAYYYDPNNYSFFAKVLILTLSMTVSDTMIGNTGLTPDNITYSHDGQYLLLGKGATDGHMLLQKVLISSHTVTTLITTSPNEWISGRFSPDDQQIYYMRRTTSSSQILKCNADGSNPTTLYTSSSPNLLGWVDVK